MSCYSRVTKNPSTGNFELADWVDDKFGRHQYGVYFPSTRTWYRDSDQRWEFDDTAPDAPPSRPKALPSTSARAEPKPRIELRLERSWETMLKHTRREHHRPRVSGPNRTVAKDVPQPISGSGNF